LTGGGKRLKNYEKSRCYLYKIFNLIKFYIKKIILRAKRRPSDRCTEKHRQHGLRARPSDRCIKNTACRCYLLYKLLTFARYDKIGGEEPRAQEVPGAGILKYFSTTVCPKKFLDPIFLKYFLTTVCPKKFLDPVFLKYFLTAVCGKIEKAFRAANIFCDLRTLIQKLRCAADDTRVQVLNILSLIPRPRFRASNCGVILIEFAVCMPVLVILLFYINDLVRIKRMYSQTEFVGQQFANIIQNISHDNKITSNDIIHACCMAYLTIYPGTTMFYKGTGFGLGHRPELFITYVVGNPDGTASCKWALHLFTNSAESPTKVSVGKETSQHKGSLVNFKQNVAPSIIYPSLKMNSTDKKIIVESAVLYQPGSKDSSGRQFNSSKDCFGYFLINPKPKTTMPQYNCEWYYHSVNIFTPKVGLFTETAP